MAGYSTQGYSTDLLYFALYRSYNAALFLVTTVIGIAGKAFDQNNHDVLARCSIVALLSYRPHSESIITRPEMAFWLRRVTFPFIRLPKAYLAFDISPPGYE